MNKTKRLGIWMDHSNAHLMEFITSNGKGQIGNETKEHQDKVVSLGRSEYQTHHKEKGHQEAYYQKLGETIKNYDEVLLFGPSDAKEELANRLGQNHIYQHVKITTQQADKMTEPQQQAFVRNFFLHAL